MFVFVNLKGGVQGGFVAKIFFGVINYIGHYEPFGNFWPKNFGPGSILKFLGAYPKTPTQKIEFFISLFSPMCDTWLESPGSQDSRTIFIFSVRCFLTELWAKTLFQKRRKSPKIAVLRPKIVPNLLIFSKLRLIMISTYLKDIIAKKNLKRTKNMVFRAKKRHFLTFFADYSKRDFGLGWVHSSRYSWVTVEYFCEIFSRVERG